jgi:TonB family protein
VLLWSILTAGIALGSSADAEVKPDVQPPSSVLAPVTVAPDPPVTVAPDPPASVASARPLPSYQVYSLSAVDVQPELVNRETVVQALSTYYPAELRDAGVTGTVTLGFTVDSLGVPDLASTSGEANPPYEDFYAAGLAVATLMRFRPARKDGRPVAVWVTLPFTFEPR